MLKAQINIGRRKTLLSGVATAVLGALPRLAFAGKRLFPMLRPQTAAQLGINGGNVGPLATYNGDRLMNEVICTSGNFTAFGASSGSRPTLDANGWPTTSFRALLGKKTNAPDGVYKLKATSRGGGPVTVTAVGAQCSVSLTSTSGDDCFYDVTVSGTDDSSGVLAVAVSAGVLGIKIMRPGSLTTDAIAPHTTSIAYYKQFSGFRWAHPTGAEFDTQTFYWTGATGTAHGRRAAATAHDGGFNMSHSDVDYSEGLPIEYIVAYNNACYTASGSNVQYSWMTCSAYWDADFLTNMFTYFRDHSTIPYDIFEPAGNETWNPIYPSNTFYFERMKTLQDGLGNMGTTTQLVSIVGDGATTVTVTSVGTLPATYVNGYQIAVNTSITAFNLADTPGSITKTGSTTFTYQVAAANGQITDAVKTAVSGLTNTGTMVRTGGNLVTVTSIANTGGHGHITGDLITVSAPDSSFNVTNASITVTSSTVFTYASTGTNLTLTRFVTDMVFGNYGLSINFDNSNDVNVLQKRASADATYQAALLAAAVYGVGAMGGRCRIVICNQQPPSTTAPFRADMCKMLQYLENQYGYANVKKYIWGCGWAPYVTPTTTVANTVDALLADTQTDGANSIVNKLILAQNGAEIAKCWMLEPVLYEYNILFGASYTNLTLPTLKSFFQDSRTQTAYDTFIQGLIDRGYKAINMLGANPTPLANATLAAGWGSPIDYVDSNPSGFYVMQALLDTISYRPNVTAGRKTIPGTVPIAQYDALPSTRNSGASLHWALTNGVLGLNGNSWPTTAHWVRTCIDATVTGSYTFNIWASLNAGAALAIQVIFDDGTPISYNIAASGAGAGGVATANTESAAITLSKGLHKMEIIVPATTRSYAFGDPVFTLA